MYLSTLIPQRIETTPTQLESWRFGHDGLLWLVDALHLHSIFAQPWFAAIMLFAALALGISSCDQWGIARRKLLATATAQADEIATGVTGALLRDVARTHRYRLLDTQLDGRLKFVRNPWGYFGNPLLHFGITAVIVLSLYVTVTARQGTLILVEGERQAGPRTWVMAEQGIFARPLELPGTIRLDKVRVQLDDKQQPVNVSSELSLIEPSGHIQPLTTSINRISHYRGLRIYHSAQYGSAFAVTFSDKNGAVHSETIAAHHPLSPTEAGYSDEFAVDWSASLLSAKYYADVDRHTLNGVNPELTLRATKGGREVARATLTTGTSGLLGEYRVQLHGVSRWAKLVIVDNRGMPLVFTGFAIIMLGGLLRYLAPPRELTALRLQHDCYTVFWKAATFRDFYLEERERLTTALHRETTA